MTKRTFLTFPVEVKRDFSDVKTWVLVMLWQTGCLYLFSVESARRTAGWDESWRGAFAISAVSYTDRLITTPHVRTWNIESAHESSGRRVESYGWWCFASQHTFEVATAKRWYDTGHLKHYLTFLGLYVFRFLRLQNSVATYCYYLFQEF